ncbi:MAG: DUF2304 domain-containing protein [Chloroflexota bacterium]
MSLQGVLLLDLFGLLLIVLLINLVRTRKLHPGFAVIWLLATGLMILIISIPPLMMGVTRAVGATFPASAMTLLAFVLVFAMLIFFSMQLSLLSTRQVEMAQKIALAELAEQERRQEDN